MEKQKLTKFQVWYQANKEKVAQRRKERYRGDRQYREKNLQGSRNWRAKNQPWKKREVMTKDYLLIGDFAEAVGCSPETIRNFERKELIPRVTDGVRRRRYHAKNVFQVARLVKLRQSLHYSDPKFPDKQAAIVERIKATWKQAA
jgi:hypothetical protein